MTTEHTTTAPAPSEPQPSTDQRSPRPGITAVIGGIVVVLSSAFGFTGDWWAAPVAMIAMLVIFVGWRVFIKDQKSMPAAENTRFFLHMVITFAVVIVSLFVGTFTGTWLVSLLAFLSAHPVISVIVIAIIMTIISIATTVLTSGPKGTAVLWTVIWSVVAVLLVFVLDRFGIAGWAGIIIALVLMVIGPAGTLLSILHHRPGNNWYTLVVCWLGLFLFLVLGPQMVLSTQLLQEQNQQIRQEQQDGPPVNDVPADPERLDNICEESPELYPAECGDTD